MNDFLKEIGRSYIVSSLLPAALFLPVGILVFYGLIPQEIFDRLKTLDAFWGQNWFLLLILIFWTGFLLYSSFQSIIEFYMGAWLPEWIKRIMRWFCKRHYSKLLQNYDAARNEIALLFKKKITRLSHTRTYAISDLGTLGLRLSIPFETENMYPTLLGNVFQANVTYIRDRYNIDGRVMWPRLLHVLPGSFLKNLEEKNNYFLFLLNSSFLAGLIGLIGLCIGLAGFIPAWVRGLSHIELLNQAYYWSWFVAVAIIFFVFYYIFYRLARNAAAEYLQIVCSGFDLYRRDLLIQMRISPQGKDLLQEKHDLGCLK